MMFGSEVPTIRDIASDATRKALLRGVPHLRVKETIRNHGAEYVREIPYDRLEPLTKALNALTPKESDDAKHDHG